MNGELIFQRGNRLTVWGSDQERLGVTGALQWRPVENVTLTLDALHGKFTNDRSENSLATRATLNSTILGAATPHSGTLVSPPPVLNSIQYDRYNSVVYADVDNTVFATETRRQRTKNTFDQLVLTGEWKVTDKLTVRRPYRPGDLGLRHPDLGQVLHRGVRRPDHRLSRRHRPQHLQVEHHRSQ
jgi:iron complex outermembrane receptor protein